MPRSKLVPATPKNYFSAEGDGKIEGKGIGCLALPAALRNHALAGVPEGAAVAVPGFSGGDGLSLSDGTGDLFAAGVGVLLGKGLSRKRGVGLAVGLSDTVAL